MSQRFRTPHVAIGIATVAPLLLVVATRLFSDEAFDAATLATTALYVSYGAPIALGALARTPGRVEEARALPPRSARRPVAGLAVLWCLFVIVVFACRRTSFPPRCSRDALIVLGALYFAVVRKRFEGPRVKLAALESDSGEAPSSAR